MHIAQLTHAGGAAGDVPAWVLQGSCADSDPKDRSTLDFDAGIL